MADKPKNILGLHGSMLMRNVRCVREGQQLTYAELSKLMAVAGRPIPVLGLRRIERGERRVDVDDLMALATVFNVDPMLLLQRELTITVVVK